MPTSVLYGDTSDAILASDNDGGTVSVNSTSTGPTFGRLTTTSRAVVLLAWDVFVVGTDAVSEATISLSLWFVSAAGPTIEVRADDWGATAEAADWVPRANLGALPLLATHSTLGTGTGMRALTSEPALLTEAAGWSTGWVRVLVHTDRHRTETPVYSGGEATGITMADSSGTASDPRLTVVHDVAATTVTAAVTLPAITAAGSVTALNAVTGTLALPTITAAGSITSPAPLPDLGPAVAILAEPTLVARLEDHVAWTAGDVESDFRAQVVAHPRRRTPVNMTGRTVTVRIRRPDGTLLSRAGTVDAGTDGWVSMQWQAGDLIAGRHEFELYDATGQTIAGGAFHVRSPI